MIEIKNNRYVRVRSIASSGRIWSVSEFLSQLFGTVSGLKFLKSNLTAQDYAQDSIATLGTDISTSALLQAIQAHKESFVVEANPKIIMTYANGFSLIIDENTTFYGGVTSLSTALLVSIDLDTGLS